MSQLCLSAAYERFVFKTRYSITPRNQLEGNIWLANSNYMVPRTPIIGPNYIGHPDIGHPTMGHDHDIGSKSEVVIFVIQTNFIKIQTILGLLT